MVVLVGPHRGGKATLLRAIGEVLLPHKGYIFVPSHLRVRGCFLEM